jgi:hypothetical protein
MTTLPPYIVTYGEASTYPRAYVLGVNGRTFIVVGRVAQWTRARKVAAMRAVTDALELSPLDDDTAARIAGERFYRVDGLTVRPCTVTARADASDVRHSLDYVHTSGGGTWPADTVTVTL